MVITSSTSCQWVCLQVCRDAIASHVVSESSQVLNWTQEVFVDVLISVSAGRVCPMRMKTAETEAGSITQDDSS